MEVFNRFYVFADSDDEDMGRRRGVPPKPPMIGQPPPPNISRPPPSWNTQSSDGGNSNLPYSSNPLQRAVDRERLQQPTNQPRIDQFGNPIRTDQGSNYGNYRRY